jgi:poly-gamma-glutamate synthesis protein (capsule biosynthesis protein)
MLPGRFRQLLMTKTTMNLLSKAWGQPNTQDVMILPDADLLETAWKKADSSLAIVPFEMLDPRWKVIRIDGISPLDSTFDPDHYPLQIMIGLESSGDLPPEKVQKIAESIKLPATNRDVGKLTSLIMTGTTALVRYTALKMEEHGVLYPAADISGLLKDADFTHISNEVPFFPDCPPAVPVRVEQRFCSDPSYFDLLDYIDVDLIELTGNHILDWDYGPLLFTLQLYENNNIPYFGGGRNLDAAQQPLVLNHHGQDLFIIGCSPAGPESVWATEDLPGSNPCNWDLISAQIKSALGKKWIPIMTFQHLEVEDFTPHSSQRVDFLRAANAGAMIVSGSQAHFAQSMTFVGDHFVHYGLGNLFFDQMYGENPHEFVDKHYFYNGKYISTELITLTLEDSAKPRIMTINERAAFLQRIFDHSSWETVFQDGVE